MKTIVIAQEYEKYRDFVEGLDQFFHKEGTTIYKARNEIKTFTLDDGIILNVKRFKQPNLINRFIYATFRKPKAVRAYENAIRMRALNINTPIPIGYMTHRVGLCVRHSYLVTFQSPLSRTMYEFGDSDLDGRDEAVRAFAHFAADLHKKGVYHKDFSPGNILFDEVKPGQYSFCLVDINRVKFVPVSLEEGCRNFCRLWGREAFFDILSKEYAKAMGADPKEVRDLIFHYHKKFWKGRYNHF